MRLALLALAAVAALAGAAEAYPQFHLSRDKTCTACHISPAGGNLLTENGEGVAEAIATIDHPGAFFYGKLKLPGWLVLGGDFRWAGGYIETPERVLAVFPMQNEAYAHASLPGGFSIHAHLGGKPPAVTREHYLMWRTGSGTPYGLFVRAGRFMPVFGLRFAEHPMYTRRFGGTPLYGETYGIAVEHVGEKAEVHATGFIDDPVFDVTQHASGGAVYTELRPAETFSIGGGAMAEISEDDKKFRGAVTAKYYADALDLLFQTEVQFMNQRVDPPPGLRSGGAPIQLIGNLVVSRYLGSGLLLDLGFGHFDSNLRTRNLDRNCVDLNLHWFTTSHIELIFNGRFEMLAFGRGGDSHVYALLQAHYRL